TSWPELQQASGQEPIGVRGRSKWGHVLRTGRCLVDKTEGTSQAGDGRESRRSPRRDRRGAGTGPDRSSVCGLRPTRDLPSGFAVKLVVSGESWSRSAADTHSRRYVLAVLDQYVSFPGTPWRASRQDRRLARELYEQAVPLAAVRAALLLGVARRTFRS